MATHSSILAWRIPGTEEPVGLLSMGLHRVRHDRSDSAAAAAYLRVHHPVCRIKRSVNINAYLSEQNVYLHHLFRSIKVQISTHVTGKCIVFYSIGPLEVSILFQVVLPLLKGFLGLLF